MALPSVRRTARPASAHLKGYDTEKSTYLRLEHGAFKSVVQVGFESGLAKKPSRRTTPLALQLAFAQIRKTGVHRARLHRTRKFMSPMPALKFHSLSSGLTFTGNPSSSFGAEMRPTDHTQQQTYAGHVWRLVDDKTKKPLHCTTLWFDQEAGQG